MSQARNQMPNRESLEETRNASRTFGCVGLSVVAHLAFLAALAIIPETIRSTGGEDAGAREAVSLIDGGAASTVAQATIGETPSDSQSKLEAASVDIRSAQTLSTETPAPEAVQAAVMTDPSSEVVVPAQPTVAKKIEPVKTVPPMKTEKPLPSRKTAKHVKPAPETVPSEEVVARETTPDQDAVQVENAPPVDENAPEEEAAASEPTPVLLANPPSDDAKPDPKSEAKAEMVPVKEEAKPVAGATDGTAASDPTENQNGSKNAVGAAEQSGPTGQAGQNGAADAKGTEGDGKSATAVAGPIRDASELKAFPGNPNPVYPARDRLAHKEGTTVVLGRVAADGRVSDVRIERSSGSADMDAASAQAFRSWRFQGGQPGWVRKPFQFRLVGDAKEVPAPLGKTLQR